MRFEAYDRHLGMVLGGVEGAFLGMIGTIFVVGLVPLTRGPILSSPSGKVVSATLQTCQSALPSEYRQMLAKFWNGDATPTLSAEPVADQVEPSAKPVENNPPAASESASLEDEIKGKVKDVLKREASRLDAGRQTNLNNAWNGWARAMTNPTPLHVGDKPINLTQVLKLVGWAENGGRAKVMIAEGLVRVNGEVESRKRRKLALGDIVTLEGGPSLILA